MHLSSIDGPISKSSFASHVKGSEFVIGFPTAEDVITDVDI